MVVLPWGTPVVPSNREEAELLAPLLSLLARTNRINPSTIVKLEMPWNGRRIDLATMSRSLTTTAYELKLSSIQRAIEQASYSRLSFDRSWVVTVGRTSEGALAEARRVGVGVISSIEGELRVVAVAQRQPRTSASIRARLIHQFRGSVGADV